MARKKLRDVAPRTLRLHVPTYNSILQFFAMSPSGLCGSDAIRQVVYHFGLYCEQQMRAGRVANSRDLEAAEQAVFDAMSREITKDQSEAPSL
jgi:hypothetical protein